MNMNMSIMMMMRRCRRLIMAGGGCLFKPSKASYFTAERIRNWDLERLEAAKNEVQGFSNNVLIPPHGEGHVAVSPHSFHVIFALLAAGSTDWTAEHWAHFFNQYSPLGISYSVGILNNLLLRNNDDHSSFPIRSSTFLWHHPQLSLHTRFLETLYQHPTLSILPLDFHNTPLVRQRINSEVERETGGLIQNVMSEESFSNSSSPVKLVFTNILHFKRDWDMNEDCVYGHPFPQGCDSLPKEKFITAEIFSVKRNIMVQGDRDNNVPCLTLGGQFRRPLGKRSLILNCCYPTQPHHAYGMNLDTSSSHSVIPNETLMEVGGRKIPKFKVFSEVDVSTMLRSHGVILPFYEGGLTWMGCDYTCCHGTHDTGGKHLYLFKIFQKSHVDLNEQGCEAVTATTAIVVSGRQGHLPPVPCLENKWYGSGLLPVGDGMMAARVGLQVAQQVVLRKSEYGHEFLQPI